MNCIMELTFFDIFKKLIASYNHGSEQKGRISNHVNHKKHFNDSQNHFYRIHGKIMIDKIKHMAPPIILTQSISIQSTGQSIMIAQILKLRQQISLLQQGRCKISQHVEKGCTQIHHLRIRIINTNKANNLIVIPDWPGSEARNILWFENRVCFRILLGSILENAVKMGANVLAWMVKLLKASANLVEAAGDHAVIGDTEGSTEHHDTPARDEVQTE